MIGRRLSPAETALWARVMADVRPMVASRTIVPAAPPAAPSTKTVAARARPVPVAPMPVRPRMPSPHLDGGWDRRISRGAVQPDSTLDLHGHTLASAHAMLDRGLERAILRGDRVLLLVTGKPPRPGSERPHARGAIRAAVEDWLLASRHADRIASVRGAHPRHGGTGALYIVLRRTR